MTDHVLNILLVDSSKLYLGILQQALKMREAAFHYASSGQEALKLAQDRLFDFIITVAQLPDMEGKQLVRTLRAMPKYALSPIVILTGSAEQVGQQIGLTHGVTETFSKQEIEEIINYMRRFLNAHRELVGRILYVEDSRDQRMFLVAQLRDWGLVVDACPNADEGWAHFLKKDYDLVITDVVLDGHMSGSRFVNRIRRLAPYRGDTPILAVTAFDSAARRIELFHLGVSDYVTKPIVTEELYARINSLLSKKLAAERDHQLMAATSMAVITTDQKGIIETVNSLCLEMFGYSEEEMIGQNVSMIIPEPHHSAHDGYMRKYVESNQRTVINLVDRELTAVRKNGDVFPINLTVNDLHQTGRRTFAGIIRDITKQKQVESLLQQGREQALEANRMKSEFLANISHEIRTPMSGVIGMTEVLLNKPLPPDLARIVRTILDAANTQLDILNDILDFSKIEADKMELSIEPFSLADIVAKICASLDGMASKKQVTLSSQIDPAVPAALAGDALRVRQIVSNFTTNAIKFSSGLDHPGEVLLSARLADQDNELVWIEIAVHDNGIGMDAVARERIFKPFIQVDGSTSRRYGGTGLGLVISQRLTEMMGGEIQVESTPDVGSKFTVRLPFTRANVEQLSVIETENLAPSAEALTFQGEAVRVLVAEDNETNQEVIRQQFKLLGYRADIVPDGREAFSRWLKGGYALVISDIQMPHMDGYQLAEAIRNEEAKGGASRTAIIALTANALKGEAEHCKACGMDDYLAKPVTLPLLKATLEKWLHAVSPPEASASAELAATLPVFDPEMLTRLVGNKPDVHRRLLDKFLVNGRKQIDQLITALKDGDSGAGMIAHSFKSSARSIGAMALGDLCERLEHACKSNDIGTCMMLVKDIDQQFDAMVQAVRSYLH